MIPDEPASAGEPADAGDAAAESSAAGAPKKKRAPRKRRSRKKSASKPKASTKAADASIPPLPDDDPAPQEAPASRGGASAAAEGDDAPRPRKKRARRTRRGRRSSRSDTERADAEGDAPAIPPLPEDDDGPAPSADGEEGEGGGRRRRRRRRRRGKRGRGGDAEATDTGELADESTGEEGASDDAREDGEDGEGGGKRRKRRRGRSKRKDGKNTGKDARKDKDSDKKDKKGKRDKKKGKDSGKDKGGRKSRRRERDDRRDRRGRDPRAIDIVPRAPTPEEAAREKILVVNARDKDEARIALLVDGRLQEIYVELAASERSSAGNIYRGRVQNVERGIGAAFVDLGRGVTGFLHASDLPLSDDDEAKLEVTERIKPGDEVIVQITRDSIGRKGPALTGRISFPGRYLVLMPFTARSGISRRIPQGPERDRVRKLLRKLDVPEGMGVIVRTASETTDLAALEADLDHLLKEWQVIKRKAAEPGQPGLLRGESDLAERSVRDIMPGDVTRIIVDKDDLAGRIHRLLRVWYPSAAEAADELASVQVKEVHAAIDAPRGEFDASGLDSEPEPEPEPEAEAAAEPGEAPEAEDGTDESAADATTDVPADDAEATPADEVSEDEAFDEEASEEDDADEAPDAPGDDVLLGILPEPDVDPIDDDEPEDEPEPEPEPETPAERHARLTRLAAMLPELELHTEAMPLFHKYNVETQLEEAYRRSARLSSGGSIVIDQTEALVAVDVNSGRLTDEADPESTALVTNLEAVDETARQLRLRDLGGLVVIDFIDMRSRSSRRQVEKALKEALSADRARIRMGRMDPFGLVTLSRQRIRQALTRVTHEACEACGGTGRRRQVSGLGLRVVREMQARVARSRGRGGLEVRAPGEVISWIKKQRGSVLKQLGRECSGPVKLEADNRLAADGWAMKGLPPAE